MKLLRYVAILLCILIPRLVWSADNAGAQDVSRAAKPMFKGFELYSWRDSASDTWRFALLPGTNRNKTLAEVTAPEHAIVNVAALRQRLAHLAVGEYVFWRSPDRNYPSFPPQPVIDDIAQAAATLKLQLKIPRS